VTTWWRRFLVRGVFWRQFLHWAVRVVPPWIEPVTIAFWSLFFLLWGPGRRGVMRNLTAIKPGSNAVTNFFRCYRVFWNYAWAITDAARFKEEGTVPDWEFTGWKNFEAMQARGGAVLLTAHMGSYDLGAQIFSQNSRQPIVMVRAPETDPQTRAFEEQHKPAGLQIEFSAQNGELALDLLHAVTSGGIVAIQGDRVTEGIAALPATMFGKAMQVPAGPFALAMAARAPIYPVFVVRRGRRRYRLVSCEPIEIVRSADRDADFAAAVAKWTERLESLIAATWYQWFAFEPFSPELECGTGAADGLRTRPTSTVDRVILADGHRSAVGYYSAAFGYLALVACFLAAFMPLWAAIPLSPIAIQIPIYTFGLAFGNRRAVAAGYVLCGAAMAWYLALQVIP